MQKNFETTPALSSQTNLPDWTWRTDLTSLESFHHFTSRSWFPGKTILRRPIARSIAASRILPWMTSCAGLMNAGAREELLLQWFCHPSNRSSVSDSGPGMGFLLAEQIGAPNHPDDQSLRDEAFPVLGNDN